MKYPLFQFAVLSVGALLPHAARATIVQAPAMPEHAPNYTQSTEGQRALASPSTLPRMAPTTLKTAVPSGVTGLTAPASPLFTPTSVPARPDLSPATIATPSAALQLSAAETRQRVIPAPTDTAATGRGTSNGVSQSLGTGTSSPSARTNLGPGPLTNAPVGITTTPNEIRISGLGSSSAPWAIVLLLTFLTLIPSLLICLTPFARLLVVFHFLRQALGLQTTPSNQTLIGLTMILTFFIMEPVGKQIYQQSFLPLQSGQITLFQAVAESEDPIRNFMVHFVREKDAALFLEIAKEPRPHNIHDLSMRVLLPAYIVSELKAGFQIGAVLFLPFLVVDMVVAAITTSVGMMQLPPVVISTPLKLLLFLMVDGWHLLIGALMRSFA